MTAMIAWIDELLRDIADKIQLAPTDYRIAQERYGSIARWIENDGSAIKTLRPLLYPQGSFRIQSSISSKLDTDEYDIDLMLEMSIDHNSRPQDVLQLVFNSLDRGPGTLYHGKVTMKRRCVSVQCEGMHLDITPAVLTTATPRTCVIFDTHPHRPDHVLSNPEGFARVFEDRTQYDENLIEMRKLAVPVPPQTPLDSKSDALICLQLLKRWRNIQYDGANNKPPSVLLACLVSEVRFHSASLLGRLSESVDHLIRRLSVTGLAVSNPACERELFTDRWPGDDAARSRFVSQLRAMRSDLMELGRSGPTLADKKLTLKHLFGERAADLAFTAVNKRFGKMGEQGTVGIHPGVGAILPPRASAPIKIPGHRFFGKSRDH
jgi:hypothetical protein